MINFINRLDGLELAALARIGQGYSPSRRHITERQNKGGVLNSVIKNSSLRFNF